MTSVDLKEPRKVLLRAHEVSEWLGISKQEFHKCVRAGLIPFKVIKKGGYRYFKTEDIKRIFLDNFRMS